MVEIFTRNRILKGAEKTGMYPLDCRVLLNHPSIQNGNVLRDAFEAQCATAVLRSAQQTDRQHQPIQQPPGSITSTCAHASTSTAGLIGHTPDKRQDLRVYARALKQSALLLNDSSMTDKITKMLSKPSSEMRELVTQLVHP